MILILAKIGDFRSTTRALSLLLFYRLKFRVGATLRENYDFRAMFLKSIFDFHVGAILRENYDFQINDLSLPQNVLFIF